MTPDKTAELTEEDIVCIGCAGENCGSCNERAEIIKKNVKQLKQELAEANEKLKEAEKGSNTTREETAIQQCITFSPESQILKSKVQEAITKLDNDGRLFRYKEVLDMLKELLSEQKGEK